ncbi:hypothetical protein [Kitasatospora sp. MAA4]|uniref:hypothetical protein n=1 Tax=Kitasatospora sp. MAA4 TaxID=3035093 RepID=UPI002473DA42|nr:hypothetical protein [Kitasatospora sp. MAA4]
MVALAGATWVPWIWKYLWADRTEDQILSFLLIAVTLLPLAAWGWKVFRWTCWTVAGLMACTVLLTGPYAIILLPLGAFFCPTAVLLLIAAKQSVGRAAVIVGTILAIAQFTVVTVAESPFSGR